MYAVIFEVKVKPEGKDEYLAIATKLKKQLVKITTVLQKGFYLCEHIR
jgi:hypothetical protein